ncbi:DUF1206 domain-containing protein [Deinococcus maricopensis]|uniref:DUF1206 domain-containing protein n=1 Tax=Deinococcus maricopensis (strain DSM 21211 / LMG 22137 / NRRL B-23946 / LB-34) TaxID=709986 RepID=E8UA51_DEIML|nr:DUF1206 domain-containing protein [Deinococcus maricopensis]ADV67940.1 protein of unknown function DUF1206 [Deinococcus maricopensis DSM 21211]
MNIPGSAARGAAALRDAASAGMDHAAPWLERLARFGYWSKGVVYLTIGTLALLRTLQVERGRTIDPRGALDTLGMTLGTTVLSRTLLLTLAFGLLGYCVWQALRALFDPERQGHAPKGLIKRAGYLLSATAYASLGWAAARRAVTGAHAANPHAEEEWTAHLLKLPSGRLLVAVVGLVFVIVAVNQLYVALRALFLKRIRLTDLGEKRRGLLTAVGQVGITARALVAAVIGAFFLQAAWDVDPEEAGSIGEALLAYETAPFGSVLMPLVALGMVVYGLYAWVQAAYRRIHIEGCLEPDPGEPAHDA